MNRPLRILALEPYAALSHRLFLEGLAENSRHDWELSTLPPRKWKWRMRTAALHFVEIVESGQWDVIFASDFLNLQELRVLLSERCRRIPSVIYFHENQLTYPLQQHEERDYHFGLTHFYSILAADLALFNSDYHRREFLTELPRLLKLVPDVETRPFLEQVEARCSVMPLGTNLDARDPKCEPQPTPTLLWSHRWEYDKNPRAFVDALYELAAEEVPFRVRVLGESFRVSPPEFAELAARLPDRIEEMGFLPDREAYVDAVAAADLFVSTARHEFFGLATLEAIRCGLYPVLPNDLAYPELVALADSNDPSPFLYAREDGVAAALRAAIRVVQVGGEKQLRQQLVDASERYHWSGLARRYDELFEDLVETGASSSR